jgi:hypothetical protein
MYDTRARAAYANLLVESMTTHFDVFTFDDNNLLFSVIIAFGVQLIFFVIAAGITDCFDCWNSRRALRTR